MRELENIMERAVILNDVPVLKKKYIYPLLFGNNSLGEPDTFKDKIPEPVLDSISTKIHTTESETEKISKDTSLSFLERNGQMKTLKQLENEAIAAGLKMTNWNMTLTSQKLGISRMTLYRKIEQHGLKKNG